MFGLLGIVANRVELFSNELEEERLRLMQVFFFMLFTLFCLCMGVLLLSMLVVLFFWQNHLLLVVALLALAFFAFSMLSLRLLRVKLNRKSRPFADTMAELEKDLNALRNSHE